MFIAHLPAGYLLGQTLHPILNRNAQFAFLVGSIAPDLDLIRFYFLDAQMVHHHTYLTHRPVLWAAVLILGALISRRYAAGKTLTAFSFGALLHMGLDSIVGAIDWGWPMFTISAPLVVVPATYDHWILSFLLHWTFAIELMICATAFVVWVATQKQKTPANDRGSSIS